MTRTVMNSAWKEGAVPRGKNITKQNMTAIIVRC
jgi:hypothetical protein